MKELDIPGARDKKIKNKRLSFLSVLSKNSKNDASPNINEADEIMKQIEKNMMVQMADQTKRQLENLDHMLKNS
jgi:hypothetical protein